MQLRGFGRTGLRVSVITHRSTGRPQSAPDYIEAVHAAARLGVSSFLVGPGPARRRRETLLGEALKSLPPVRGGAMVGTELRVAPDVSADDLRYRVDRACKRLGTDQLSIAEITGVRSLAGLKAAAHPGGPIEALLRLRMDGRVGLLMLGVHHPSPAILPIVRTRAFDAVCLSYGLHTGLSALEHIQELAEAGVGIVSCDAFGGRRQDRMHASPELGAMRLLFNAAHPWISSVALDFHDLAEAHRLGEALEHLGMPSAAAVAELYREIRG